MATNTGEVPKAANAPAEAIDASLMVATRRGDCQKLKDLIIKKDATTMDVVMASSNQESEENSSPARMHPLLAAAACRGNLEELEFLLSRGSLLRQEFGDNSSSRELLPPQEFRDQLKVYYPGNSSSRSLAMRPTADRIEEGTCTASSILEGVTVEGDTALHLLAANGDNDRFKDCVDLIYRKDNAFLYKENYNGDTPLHCAVRTGNSCMASHLIGLARSENRVVCLLRKENHSKETALHEAVRIGDNDIVKDLLTEDPKLARFPEEGPSPLYLAIFLEEGSIAQTLYDKSEDHAPSYSGPDGQNALHIAVMRGTEMVKMLLEWNRSLASEVDSNGSTPLHSGHPLPVSFMPLSIGMLLLLQANPAAVYQPDNRGMFPIHIAANMDQYSIVDGFIRCHPRSAGLRNRRGRTFLHIAAKNSRWRLVRLASRTPSLAWILNMQDADGNTALHLATQAGSLRSFASLLGNRQVHLNLANKKGQTPLDISQLNIPPGIYHVQSTPACIHRVLNICHARRGSSRRDHFEETSANKKGQDFERNEMEKLKDSTQTLCIGSVLIATVTFGVTFALPGGYRADDHTNGGTPTLAGRFSFDAFMIATALAFICSAVGTTGLMFSGLPMVDLKSRKLYFSTSAFFVASSVVSLTAAFALGVHMVLAPVAQKTAVAVSVISPLVAVCANVEFFLKWALLARPLYSRVGLIRVLMIIPISIIVRLLYSCWTLLLIFSWPVIARNH